MGCTTGRWVDNLSVEVREGQGGAAIIVVNVDNIKSSFSGDVFASGDVFSHGGFRRASSVGFSLNEDKDQPSFFWVSGDF